MKHLIIYHANCNDGFGAAWAAATSEECHMEPVELYPISYGMLVPMHKIDSETHVHILDFSFSPEDTWRICDAADFVTLLDHHKSAIDKFNDWDNITPEDRRKRPDNITLCLHASASGAMLAWNHYHAADDRVPKLIQYIQDRDLWTKHLRGCDDFHLNLSTQPQDIQHWSELAIFTEDECDLDNFIAQGAAIKRFYDKTVASIVESNIQAITVAGKYGICCNAHGAFASDVGNILAKKSKSFGMTWEELAGCKVKFSLRSEGDYDVAAMAALYGGGGHKNAAGFVLEMGEQLENFYLTGTIK